MIEQLEYEEMSRFLSYNLKILDSACTMSPRLPMRGSPNCRYALPFCEQPSFENPEDDRAPT
jgi:hypothetical protein